MSVDRQEGQDEALELIVGEDAWDTACIAYDLAVRKQGRPHRDALRCALLAAQMAVHSILNQRPEEPAESEA